MVFLNLNINTDSSDVSRKKKNLASVSQYRQKPLMPAGFFGFIILSFGKEDLVSNLFS